MLLNPKILLVGAVAAAAIATGSMAVAKPGSQIACKQTLFVASSDQKPSEAQANLNAQFKWSQKVASALGQSWASWGMAAQKSINCGKAGPSVWRCIARARPCGPESLIQSYEPRRTFDLPRFRMPRRPARGPREILGRPRLPGGFAGPRLRGGFPMRGVPR